MSTETVPVRLTGPLCKAMPIGTELVGDEGYWKGASYVKTTPSTWAMFMGRPTPADLWEAVEARRNNLSPYPDGLAFVYEPPAKPNPTPSLPTQDGDDDGREAAPLDPKSVHIGDTVTVRFKETGDEIVTKAYQPDDITASGEYVYLLGWPLHRANGTFGLAFSHFEILAIEPAPKPEPVHEPGTVAVVVQGGDPGAGVDDHEFRAALQTDGMWVGLSGEAATSAPVSVRPLVVIDPAAVNLNNLFQAYIAHAVAAKSSPFGATEDEARHAGIDGVLAELGIRATS